VSCARRQLVRQHIFNTFGGHNPQQTLRKQR
jgi:hypothetical protein